MKFRVTMTCPDALDDAIREAVQNETRGWIGLPDDVPDEMAAEAKRVAGKWFRYGELVSLTIDTESETISVDRA